MADTQGKCPNWLLRRIEKEEGTISFDKFMDWSLNDPDHGAYASGRLSIGRKGDFVTSPSLGNEFSDLLAIQVIDWLTQLTKFFGENQILSLVDVGPGEGHLSRGLINAIEKRAPLLLKKLELILIEVNQGMINRQKRNLESINSVSVTWKTLDDLEQHPIIGIVIANELLDALPVERILTKNDNLYRQGVSIIQQDNFYNLTFVDLPITNQLKESIEEFSNTSGFEIPPSGAADGWTTEWHLRLESWFEKISKVFEYGSLLIIDYALDAARYFNQKRSSGTLIAYRNNVASTNILNQPGYWDLTSHLCLETLLFFAQKTEIKFLGEVRQGEALLSLGLSERLYSLQSLPPSELAIALKRRETLLRLVDPSCLGDFRWIAFQCENMHSFKFSRKMSLNTRFLHEPIN